MKSKWLSLLFPLLTATAFAQTTTNPPVLVHRDNITPHWFASAGGPANSFWYRIDLADHQREFILVDAVAGKREPAFDHARLAKALSDLTASNITASRLPFDNIKFADDGKSLRLVSSNAAWDCNLTTYQVTASSLTDADSNITNTGAGRRGGAGGGGRRGQRAAGPAVPSPDGKWEVLVHGNNLFLHDLKSDKTEPLTYDGNPSSTYARNADEERFVNMNFDVRDPDIPTPEVAWSPDSCHLVAMRFQPGTQRSVYEVESSPEDQLQPKLESYPYLKAGDTVPIHKPHLFDVATKKEIPLDEALFTNPWSISDLRWNPDSSHFTFLFNQRGHQALRILGVDAATGTVKPVVDEESKTFICYSGKFFSEYLDESAEIIWMSERDGWNHLYLYDAKTSAVKNQITKGEWVVRNVDRVDREKRQIYFQAGGIVPGQDPYYIQYCRVNFDGSGLTVLTEGDGTHVVQYSPDRSYFIDTWSRVDQAPASVLRHGTDGKLVCKLEEADASDLLATGWKWPERFSAKARDGKTDIYGVIWRPKNFDEHAKYPVIEDIYAGPQGSFAPKPFSANFQQQRLADLGFIVVQMDGLGTANRSKAFHDYCYKNLADAGFPDRILWIKAAAAKYASFDLSRVGIYGTSAGGQNALRGLLSHGDFYKAGVSDSGCHDNRMDKIWWNEQWMGWPLDESYPHSSNVSDAYLLQGRLLLMVGEMDKNVDPSSSMQVVNALIKSKKDFELLYMPGAGHGVARTPYGAHRLDEFFVRTFLGKSQFGDVNTTSAP
jgi:dipeptidyl-peptidase 4